MNLNAANAVSALLATLPAEVLSLSLGMALDDTDGCAPSLAPRLEATIRGRDGLAHPFYVLNPLEVEDESAAAVAWDALYALSDDLRAAVAPFAHLLPVDDLLTVSR